MAWTSETESDRYLLAAVLLGLILSLSASGQDVSEKPILVVESFGAARAYATGTDPITLVATIRNVGKSPLPADSARARLITLAGLENVAGDAHPKLPALAAGAAETYKWQVAPTRPDASLAASLSVAIPGEPILVRAIAIPHLETPPSLESPAVSRTPEAESGPSLSVLENERIRVRILKDVSGIVVLILSARTAGGWRQVGASVPLAETESGEPGQHPWWEQFEFEEARAANSAGQASLTLKGQVGPKWRADIELIVRTGSAVVDAELKLTALRPVNLLGLRFLPLLAGEGSFGAAVSELLDTQGSGPAAHRAVRWGGITVGTVRRNEAALAGWQVSNTPVVEGADFRLLAAEHRAPEQKTHLVRGAVIRLRTRLFALYPSALVREAVTVAPPVSVAGSRPHRTPVK